MSTAAQLESPPSTSPSGEPYELRIVTSRDKFADLETFWRSLGADTGGPIEQFEWAFSCATSGDAVGDLQIVTVNRGNRLAAVAPLIVKRVSGVRRRVMLGVDQHHEPADLLARDPESMAQLAKCLARDPQPIVFGRLPADSMSVEALRNTLGERGLVVVRPQSSFPYIELDESWLTPEDHLNARRRSDLRRARRRAEQLGTLVIEVCSPQPDELDTLLDEAFAVEARSWKGLAGTAMACDSAEATFCRDYAHAACRQNILRMCFLRISGYAVAMQMAMVHGGGYWLLKIGYDARFAHCSPGILLLRESIAYAAEAGLDSFEFLGQTEPWIEVWTDRKRRCISLRVYPYNIHGGAALMADLAVKLAGVVKQRFLRVATRLRGVAKASLMPLMKRAARNYIAGDSLSDAESVMQGMARQGLLATIGFWDTERDNARAVADQYLVGLDALARDDHGAYLSIKLPALRFSAELLSEVVGRARTVERRIHLDALEPEAADRTRDMVDSELATAPSVDIGYTLPGRWRRSLDDAHWVSERGLFVRVVKGEWPDPADPHKDMRAGFLEVIDELAGRARRVGVATHDPELAAEAIRRLQAAGTPCDLELLYGLPARKSIRLARELGIDVRIYVPYGEAYMPYALSQLRRKPRVVWWLAKDLAASVWERRASRPSSERTISQA